MSKKEYDKKGMWQTCLNCGNAECSLAEVGNEAKVNENNGCWKPRKEDVETMVKIVNHLAPILQSIIDQVMAVYEAVLPFLEKTQMKNLGEETT